MERHVADIPGPKTHPWKYRYVATKWRLGLAVATHPVLVALVITMLVCSIPIWQLVGVSGQYRHQQAKLDSQQAAITGLVKEIQVNRAATTEDFCERLNANSRQAAKLTRYLKALILAGTQQGRVFEPLYRQFGFPDYAHRLAQAKRQADKIASFSPQQLGCQRIRQEIESQTPPGPVRKPPPEPPH